MVTFGPHFYFAIILLLYNAISVNSFESVRTITVHITDENGASAPFVKATLWFDTAIYQFTIDKPQRNTEYSLSSNEFTTIGQSDCMDASDAKIMLEVDDTNGVYIDWITFETYSGTWYGMDGYCADDQSAIDYYLDPSSIYPDWIQEEPECPLGYSHLHFCVDNQMDECGPAKHIYYFDTSKPNQSILTAEAISGMNTVVQIETCAPTAVPSTKTHTSNPVTITPTTNTVQPSAFPTKSLTERPVKHTSTLHVDDSEQSTADDVFYVMVSLMSFCCVCCIVFAIKKYSVKDMTVVDTVDTAITMTSSSNVQQVIQAEATIENEHLKEDSAGDGGGVQKAINLQYIIDDTSEEGMQRQDSEDLFRDMGAENASADTATETGTSTHSTGQRIRTLPRPPKRDITPRVTVHRESDSDNDILEVVNKTIARIQVQEDETPHESH